MSWSFEAIGKQSAVKDKIIAEAATPRCSEPEETIRVRALNVMVLSVSAYAEGQVVHAKGHGSMYKNNNVVEHNAVSISVAPIYGFVE